MKKNNSKQKKQNKNLTKPTEERENLYFSTTVDWTLFILNVVMQENLWLNGTSCCSFTVESESIGMGNMHIVHKVFLTQPILQYNKRRLADTDKYVMRLYQKWAR